MDAKIQQNNTLLCDRSRALREQELRGTSYWLPTPPPFVFSKSFVTLGSFCRKMAKCNPESSLLVHKPEGTERKQERTITFMNFSQTEHPVL